MHAVARIVLHGLIDNIQASWVKMGHDGALACLSAGANDLGGTLMNESITRAAGAEHGQEWPVTEIEQAIEAAVKQPLMRNTRYQPAPEAQRLAALQAQALTPCEQTPAGKLQRSKKTLPLAEIH